MDMLLIIRQKAKKLFAKILTLVGLKKQNELAKKP